MQKLWMAVLLWVSLFFLIGLAAPSATAEIRYDLDVTYDPVARTLCGIVDVTFEPQSEQAFFLLLPNLAREKNPFTSEREMDRNYPHGYEPASVQIERVEWVQSVGTTALSFRLLALPPAVQIYSLEDTVLAVDLPQATGASMVIRFQFTTEVPRRTTGDEEIDEEILTWRMGWYPLLLPPEGRWCEEEGRLAPCSGVAFPFSWPAASYDASIWLPEGFDLLCGADHIEPILDPALSEREAQRLRGYHVWNDGPARTLAIAAGSSYERFVLPTPSVEIEVFTRAGHEEEARLFATYAAGILDDYQGRFGPYPRARLVIVENPNRRGIAMAADGIVWLSSLFPTHRDVTLPGILNRYCEFVLAHEIAHQWWGLCVGVDHNAEDWLSEGLAQYLALSYYERRHGAFGPNLFCPTEAGLLEDLVRSLVGFMNLREHQVEFPYLREVARGFDEELVKPWTEVRYDNASSVRIYDKGYLVARTLAAAVGEEVFESGLREALQRFHHRVMSVGELRIVLEEEAGRSLEDIFRVWLFETETVDYAVEIVSRTKTKTGHHTRIAVSRAGGAVQPVVIEATLVSGQTVRQEWKGEGPSDTLSFETSERVTRVTIDPDHLLPDCDRLNNNAPIKFVTTTGKNAFPLDAYLVRPDPFTRGITITYLDRLRLSLVENALGASVSWDRSHRFTLDVWVEQDDLAGAVEYAYTSFSQPETGSSGSYWEPDVRASVTAQRVLTGGDPFCYFHFEIVDLPSLQYSRTSVVSFDLSLSQAGRVAVSSFDETRLSPNVYLQGEVSLGISFGELPSSLLFHLGELRSTAGVPFSGRHKLYGSVALEFPVGRDEFYNLANLMMVDRTRARAFLACGSSWTSLDEFGKTTPYLEVGVEELFDLSAIGGLLSLNAVVGYATPLSELGKGMIYLSLYL
jgi:hypothetical protein